MKLWQILLIGFAASVALVVACLGLLYFAYMAVLH